MSCISGYIKHILSSEQKKSDFKTDSDDQVIAGQTAVFLNFHIILCYNILCCVILHYDIFFIIFVLHLCYIILDNIILGNII